MVARIREVEEALGIGRAAGGVDRRDDEPRQPRQEPGRRARHRGRARSSTADAVDIKSPGPRPPAQRPRPARRPHRATAACRAGDFFYATDLGGRRAEGARRTRSAAPGACPCATTTRDRLDAGPHARLPRVPLLLQGPRARPGRPCFADRPALPLPMGYACHTPDLFPATSSLNLAERRRRRTGSARSPSSSGSSTSTRSLRPLLHRRRRPGRHRQRRWLHLRPRTSTPTQLPAHVRPGRRRPRPGRRRRGAPVAPRPCRPFPWYMGGQLFCNLFVDAADTAEFAARVRSPAVPRRLAHQAGGDLPRPARSPRPSSCSRRTPSTSTSSTPWASTARASRSATARSTGPVLAQQLDAPRPRRRLHPRDLAGPRQRRRGLLAGAGAARGSGSERGTPCPPPRCGSCRSARWPASAGTCSTSPRSGCPGTGSSSCARRARSPTRLRARGTAVVDGARRTGARHPRVGAPPCGTPSAPCAPPSPHSHLSWADVVTAVATVGRPTALVTTEHGIADDDLVYHGTRVRARLKALAHTARLRRADAVDRGGRRDRAQRARPSGTRPARRRCASSATASTACPNAPRAHRDCTCCSIARLAPEKRIDHLLRAFALVARTSTPAPG